MNLNHLRAFVKVIQTRSFREAASQLNVSQPAITQRIQTLEEQIGTKLLNRISDGVFPTSAGELVYQQSITILKMWDDLVDKLQGNRLSGRLIIGASTIPSEYLLPPIIKEFRTHYPDIHIHLRISGSGEVLKWLSDRTVDIAVTGNPENYPSIESYPVYQDELMIIVPLDTETGEIHEFIDLLRYDWILREEQSNTRRAWEKELLKRGYTLDQFHVVGQMGSTEAVIAAVEAGLGISAVSSLAAKRAEKFQRVKILPLNILGAVRTFYISCHTENIQQPINSMFIKFLLNNKEDLI